MSKIVIKIENLYKEYRLGVVGHGTLYRDLQSWWAKIRGKEDPNTLIGQSGNGDVKDHILALNDIKLEVKDGEVLGIIGANGAGKSTLLKILSRVTAPTKGTVKVKGRIASLLEVGTGFHSELTGRENIYLNGSILGMSKREIDDKFDEIVKFAELRKFLDTPVKRYSTGMYVRLAFAVAAHLEPEILLIDEVLAVGDAAFQKKCLGKLEEVAKEGRTVLFVSHNMVSIQNLCTKGILLESGKISMEGNVKAVVQEYLKPSQENTGEVCWTSPTAAPGDDRARLKAVRIVSEGRVAGYVDIDKEFHIEIEYWNLGTDSRLAVFMHIFNSMNVCVLTSANFPSASITPDPWYSKAYPCGVFRTTCTIPGCFLNDGSYKISLFIDRLMALEVLSFEVQDTGVMRKEYAGPWIGTVRPRLDWQTTQLS